MARLYLTTFWKLTIYRPSLPFIYPFSTFSLPILYPFSTMNSMRGYPFFDETVEFVRVHGSTWSSSW
ncbi:MAG: hypothetical protein MJZ94_10210 [Bacteroidales bacterium]|nr:hypothetical protein [Bacteroidales bacterium]